MNLTHFNLLGRSPMATEIYEVKDQEEELEEDYLPTFEHGVIEANIEAELRIFLKGKKLGRVTGSSAEFRFLAKPDDNRKPGRQPDISFMRQEKLPHHFRSYPDLAPDLAV